MDNTEIETTISTKLDDMQEELVNLCVELVSIPSITDSGKEEEAARFVASWLRNHGIDVVVEDYFEGKGNLIATINKGGHNKRLVFNGHLDVVPVDESERWRGDMNPFEAKVKGGYIYGRGTVDMKGNLSAMAMAAIILNQLEVELNGELVLNFVSDEEQGGVFGTEHCIKNNPQYFENVDAVIVGEPTGMPSFPLGITFSEKGILWIEFTTHAESIHGSMGDTGESAIFKMVNVVSAIRDSLTYQVTPKFGEDILRQYLADGVGLEAANRLWDDKTIIRTVYESNLRLTKALTMFHAGQKENQVPATCKALFDFRCMVEQDQDEVLEKIKNLILNLGYTCSFDENEKNVDVTITIKKRHSASRMENHDHEIIKAIQLSNKAVFQNNAFLIAFPASSDARIFRNDGEVPGRDGCVCKNTVLFGAGEAMLSHAKNERIPVKELISIAKIYALIAYNFLR